MACWVGLGVILVVALWLRVYLAGTPGYPADLQWFYMWASAAHRGNVGSPYLLEGNAASNYPPGYVLVLSRVPWLYELFTGQPFWQPPDKSTGQVDEVERAFAMLNARRDLVKVQDLVVHYSRDDTDRYRAIMEQGLVRLNKYGLITRDEFGQMQAARLADPDRYAELLEPVAARIETALTTRLPYVVPDRMRQLAVWIKLPALLLDLAGAAVLFVLLRRRLADYGALIVAAVYVFLPAVLYDSASWGQVDAVHSLMMLLCLASLLAGWWFLVGLVFAAALLTKFQSIVILPVLAAGLIRRWRDELSGPSGQAGDKRPAGTDRRGSRSARSPTGAERVFRSVAMLLAGGAVAAGLILAPFVLTGTADEALATYQKATEKYHWVSVCAFNPWWLLNPKPEVPRWYYVFIPEDQVPFVGSITPKHIGLLALGGFSLWVMWLVYRRGCRYEPIAAAAVTMAMGFFILPTQIHERYGFPAMILAAYLIGAGWRHLPVLLALSVAQFYNFAAVQPMEDPRYAWLMPVANALQGHGGATYLMVLIHVGCLVYFTVLLYRMPVRLVVSRDAVRKGSKARRGPSRRSRQKGPRGSR